MEENLTTKQVQEILKVDRITIYRMLQDRRLKGVKIGQQWRFPRSEVEKLLRGEMEKVDVAAPAGQSSAAGFPIHCIQTIQNLFSDISLISAVVLDMQGNPLTQPSHVCGFCRLMFESSSAFDACRESWKQFAHLSMKGEQRFTCHAGLNYTGVPVLSGGSQVALFLSGEYLSSSARPDSPTAKAGELAALHQVDRAELQAAADEVRFIPPEEQAEAERWPFSAAQAIQSILQERSNFIQRLQQISNLTQI